MALAKFKTASAIAVIVVALGLMTAIVTNNNAAQTKPALPETWQIQGRSTYTSDGTNVLWTFSGSNGPVTWPDAGDFSVTVTKCTWQIVLQHVAREALPNSTTQIGDDGTNYIVFVPGAAGTSNQGGELMRYEDTSNIYKSGSIYPPHRARAVWLLFASNCAMTNTAGDIENFIGPPAELKCSYERFDDPEKNSFGPSMVRIFAKLRLGEPRTNVNVLVAEVEVLESQRKDGYVTPRRAEFRQINQRPGEKTIKVMAVYQLSNISLVRNPSVSPWPPPITRPTSIQDFRHHLYRFEYVSSKWTTEEEALQLMRSGKVTMYPPQ